MKNKNCVHFLLAILLLISGSTPVLAQTPVQCGSVEPIRPGDTVTDAVSDVPAAHIDITEVETSLSGESLTVVFHLKGLPETLRFNRSQHGEGSKEYEWEVAIDADNDRSTGPGGFDYLLTAYHIAFLSHEGTDADTTAPIGEMLEAAVWEARSDGSTSTLAGADLAVSAEEETITITGHIPGITSESRLTFSAFDVEFAPEADQIDCHAPFRESMGPWGCDAVAAVTAPGQTVWDEIEGATDPHMDITRVDTSLAGETLTVVFHLRDVPETLTFNRPGISANYMEYGWVVVIDTDNDRETGSGGFEYQMLASYSVPPSEEGSNAKAPIESKMKVSVWSLGPGGSSMPAAGAILEVSPEEDTITLSGNIPGITTESRLAFRTNDFWDSFDEVGCFTSQIQSTHSSQCDTDDAVRPGQTYADEAADVRAAHIDITGVETSLSGERLTVVFHLRDVPETLTFNRTGISEYYMEYGWKVSIDIDNDRETGNGGIEYILSASHFVPLSEKGKNAEASIGSKVEAGVLKARTDGFVSMIDATLEVSPEEDTITLSGDIPGITEDSQLTFSAYDYFSDSDGVECPAAPDRSAPQSSSPTQCRDGDPTVAPGQTAIDDDSDVSAGYLDIVEVSTSLSGEMLTVIFRFRDIPETLTFNKTGTSAGSMEYGWEVSIDADGDPETGDGGFEYLLSAYHIVWPAHEGDNTEAPIEEAAEASVWEKRPGEGIRSFRDASLEVSAEEDTMILRGRVPGITPDSRLSFWTHEYLAESDGVGCQEPPGLLTSSSQCDIEGAVTPGESVIDDVSDALAAHVDVMEISTSLSGETLTVVFHLRDVPEELTFNRTGVPEHAPEYSWEVSIDVDGDQDTGLQGFEYILSAMDAAFPASGVRDRSAAFSADNLQINTWHLKSAGNASFPEIDLLGWARIEVSAEEDTITLSGEIPGITAESQLAFGAYDYFGGAEEVGCLAPFGLGRPPSFQGSFDGSEVMPGRSVSGDVSHELAGYIDIRGVTTALDGETLTVTFQLRDVPETLTFDRTGAPAHALEYSWEVSIDVDNDAETGDGGIDYMLSAGYVVHPLVIDSNTAAKITEPGFVTAGILGLDGEGNRVLAEAGIEVSAGENRITLSGEIPGITADSPLKFRAYDFFEGAVEMSSYGPSITGEGADSCQSDSAAIRPGQSVVDAVSETLPAYMDITEVSTALTDDGRLVVVFHLRDVPETLEFNRKGVPRDALEYSWRVSVDVVDDRETGLQQADYSLSASHFVFSPSRDAGVHQPVEEAVQVDTWKMDPDGRGAAYLSSASIEVSSEDDTITLIGDIPGITSESRLEFEVYDLLHDSEQVACQVLSILDDNE
ncbi:MAG: hypothetical protein OXF86_03735 [Caldilineaceae bacterium]|nr:hypothetical protein [Caldilineaceae bacterium]